MTPIEIILCVAVAILYLGLGLALWRAEQWQRYKEGVPLHQVDVGTGWTRVRFILLWPYLIAVDRIAGAMDEYDGMRDFLAEWGLRRKAR